MLGRLLKLPAIDRTITGLKHPRLLNSNFDYRNTLYVGGGPRSGTTWLAQLVSHDRRYREMHEPFNAAHVPAAAPFFSALYLRPNDDTPEYVHAAHTILSGMVGNRGVDQDNFRWFRPRRLVKEVIGNLWMKWLREHFPEMPMVWIIRHPCAVVHSRLELGWPTPNGQYLAQRDLMEDYLEPLRSEIEDAQTEFGKQMFNWCIQHYIPLRQLDRDDVHVVFYESLCVDPEAELHSLSDYVGRSFGMAKTGRVTAKLAAPSRSNFRKTTFEGKSGVEIAAGWQRILGSAQVREALRILELFGLDALYDETPFPKVENLGRLFRSGSAKEPVETSQRH